MLSSKKCNARYYYTIKQHTPTVWKELVKRMILDSSVLWRTDKNIQEEGGLIYLLDEEEYTALIENMTDAELLSNIKLSGKVDTEYLLQRIILKKRTLFNV